MTPYVIDNDLHIHSFLSPCSKDEKQTPARILQYAVENEFSTICLTDHFWDVNVPTPTEAYARCSIDDLRVELPQAEGVRFLFGVETDMDKYYTIGVSDKVMDMLDFILIPTTHLHMAGFTIDEDVGFDEDGIKRRRELYVKRFEKILSSDLPFHKIGIPHLTTILACRQPENGIIRMVEGIPDETFRELFTSAAKKGIGIELNFPPFRFRGADYEANLRPYRIAKECGCKFYFGSDAHHPTYLSRQKDRFYVIAHELGLEESDKFII